MCGGGLVLPQKPEGSLGDGVTEDRDRESGFVILLVPSTTPLINPAPSLPSSRKNTDVE